jgi:hypothetical protein
MLLVFPPNVGLDWKVIANYKHSSLFGHGISDEEKKFYENDTICFISYLYLYLISGNNIDPKTAKMYKLRSH